jgi:DNA-binding transcriptional LysR family regulator
MDRWHAMKVFVKVAEAGSFTRAARLLFMTPTAVTRAVGSLEETLAARLFTRTTRVVKLTEVGSQYLQDCRRILADLGQAEAAAGASVATPSGMLTITAPLLFGQTYVLPILLEYLTRFPLVTGRTLFTNRVTNIVDEEIDVAIRIGHLPDSTHRAIQVGSVRSVVCGAPSYFEAHGMPRKPSDLADHVIVAAEEGLAPPEWRFGGRHPETVTVHPRLFCGTDGAAMTAVIAGWGLTRLFAYKVAPAVLAGELQCVLSEYEEPPLPIHVMRPETRHVPAKVKVFMDMVVSGLRENPFLN